MIRATFSVLALFIDSDQSLTRSLSPVDCVAAEKSLATRWRQLFSRENRFSLLQRGPFSHRIRHSKPQKPIQYPETRPGSVQ
jgi:hypothetical protein